TAARIFLPLAVNAAGSLAPTMTLSGPLLSASRTEFKTGDPTVNGNTFPFVFVVDSARLTSTSPLPLLAFDSSSVDTAGNLVGLRRSTSAATPSTLTLAGPLFSATNGSTFNTTSLGFGAQFGTPRFCCSGFSVGQGAQLTSSAASALIQLSGNSIFNAGPDAQSGSTFFSVFDTFAGAPASELVAPAAVSLTNPGGSLLSVTGGSISALFSLVSVNRSSLTSSGTGALLTLNGATLMLGGTNAVDGSLALADVLFVESRAASSPVGTSASTASVALAGPLLSATNATLTMNANVVAVVRGATLS